MILNHTLTEAEQRRSQQIYRNYCGLNAIAMVCSSSTLQTLLALQLGFGTAFSSCLSPMEYLRFAFLPLGFLFARRHGVGGGKRVSLSTVGFLCLLIGCSAWMPRSAAIPMFLASVFLMSSSMATLWAMEFPLQKNIATAGALPRMLTINQCVASASSFLSSILIAWILHRHENAFLLSILFFLGAFLYFLNGWQISRMPEPALLKKLASRPLLYEFQRAWRTAIVRRQMPAGCIQNLVLATMMPSNILAAKQACGCSDSQILLLTTAQTIMILLAAWLFKQVTERHGPRRMMIATWPAVWLTAAYWCLVPASSSFFLLLPPFLLAGFINVGFSTSTASYFTLSVPNEYQVGGTIAVYIFHGSLAGVLGVLLNPLVFKLSEAVATPGFPITQFRIYFLVMGLLSLPGILAPLRLPEFFKKNTAKSIHP